MWGREKILPRSADFDTPDTTEYLKSNTGDYGNLQEFIGG